MKYLQLYYCLIIINCFVSNISLADVTYEASAVNNDSVFRDDGIDARTAYAIGTSGSNVSADIKYSLNLPSNFMITVNDENGKTTSLSEFSATHAGGIAPHIGTSTNLPSTFNIKYNGSKNGVLSTQFFRIYFTLYSTAPFNTSVNVSTTNFVNSSDGNTITSSSGAGANNGYTHGNTKVLLTYHHSHYGSNQGTGSPITLTTGGYTNNLAIFSAVTYFLPPAEGGNIKAGNYVATQTITASLY